MSVAVEADHVRRRYGAEIRPSGDALEIRCVLGSCDWTEAAEPKETTTKFVLFQRWMQHRRAEHRDPDG